MLVPDGAEARYAIKMRDWLFKLTVGFCVLLLVGIILFFAFYGKVLSMASQAGELKEENDRLLRYYYKVQLLEQNLIEAREVVTRLTELAGIDYEFPEFPEDSTLFAAIESQQAVASADKLGNFTVPNGLPIQGFISQDFETKDSTHYHPGIDIACAVGTPVLTTASGIVTYADFDSTYGYMVVVQHSDTISTLYGHNSELLVHKDQTVPAGARIALSGNSGISSAPHLHYEIRLNDKPIDPMEFPYDQK